MPNSFDIEVIKIKTESQYQKMVNAINEGADFIDRFPLELSPLLQELKNKTDDVIYTKRVLETYMSMASEAKNYVESLLDIFLEMKELQMEINPQNFNN